MELRHLRYFIAVAEELHFGRAAERLGISQPPLSQQIQALEEEIGARLFERTNRRVELTDAGRLFLDESRQVLAQVDKALLEESLQVGVIRPLALPDAVHWVELFREPLVAVLRADHPLAAGSEDGLAIAALAEEPFVFFPRSYGTGLYDQVIALTRQAGFSPRIAQEASEAMTIIGLVSAGLGVSILPASFRRTRVDGVVYRTLSDPEATTAVWLVRRQNEGSPLALSFIDLVTREAASLRRR
ncbi:TPA: LysR family transcriptional regulator [Pseudomonas aeruginosa]